MIPEAHRQHYQVLGQALAQLGVVTADPTRLKAAISPLQQQFQQIVALGVEDLDPATAQRVYACQVEIDKQLRLLSMDAMFLQAARQSTTAQQRQQQVRDRIQTLIGYCQAMVEQAD